MKTESISCKGPVREQNQDRFLIRTFPSGSILLAVADGAGGEPAGEQASEIVRETLMQFDPESEAVESQLVELMMAADRHIVAMVEMDQDLRGMGSTMTAAFVLNGVVRWAHVGDSRLYLFRGNKLYQKTEDDTMAGFLLSEGELTKEEARNHPGRNLLFECVGCGHFEVKIGDFRVQEGDLILLTTDGLHDKLREEKIVSILRSEVGLKEKLEALASSAIEVSGRDNVTVVAMQV
jgi:protein phosphatase